MDQSSTQTMPQTELNSPPRPVAMAVALAGTLFWLYTFYAIAQVPVGDGSGFQWLAVMPLSGVFLFFTLPALILSFRPKQSAISLGFGIIGLAFFAVLWAQLTAEFAS